MFSYPGNVEKTVGIVQQHILTYRVISADVDSAGAADTSALADPGGASGTKMWFGTPFKIKLDTIVYLNRPINYQLSANSFCPPPLENFWIHPCARVGRRVYAGRDNAGLQDMLLYDTHCFLDGSWARKHADFIYLNSYIFHISYSNVLVFKSQLYLEKT